jgi:hypothetical protein
MSEDLTGTIRRQRHSSGESSIWVLTVSGWVLIYSTVTRIAEQLSVENSRVVGSIPGTPAYTQEMKRRSSGSDNGGDL